MERRALLAVAISVLILVLYQEFVIKQYSPPPEEGAGGRASDTGEVVEPLVAPPAGTVPVAVPLAPEVAASPDPVEMPEVEVVGRDIVVETKLYSAVFTTAGARLKSFRLKKYRTSVEPDSPPLELLDPLLPSQLSLGLILRGQSDQMHDAAVEYAVDRERLDLTEDETGSLTFTGELAGATVTKRIEVASDQYFIGVEVQADGVDPAFTEMALSWSKSRPAEPQKGKETLFDSVVVLEADKLRHENFDDLDEGILFERDVGWIGYSGKYFLDAIVPGGDEDPSPGMQGLRASLQAQGGIANAVVFLPAGMFGAHLTLYLGPKELARLQGHSLRRAVDLGWFSFIALPMLQVLRLSHNLSGNYGVDIILLTVLIKILFFPLTQKSFKSMKDMQKLQPQMAKIKEQLKDKPEEMNKEIMELYRRHKVNPLGGCLPMLFQMPVFIGLYQALLNSVELRHAPFVGWINDLSAPDRLGSVQIPFVEPAGVPILTLFMGGSMLVQQWMTPMTTGDPMQQRMMMLMPLVFTFMFINFPSGLTLYWLVNNVLTIGQQYLINRPARAR